MVKPPDREQSDRSSAGFSALRQAQVLDYQNTAEALLPVSEASVTQLQSGPALSNLEIFSSEKISVMGERHHVKSVGVVIIKPDCYAFMWWDGKEDYRINGQSASHAAIYAQGAQDGFHAVGGARRTMGVAVRRNEFVETLAALRGVGPEDVDLNRLALELLPEAASRFRSEADVLLRRAIRHCRDSSASADPVNISEQIFGLLVEAYIGSPPILQREDRLRLPERIVRQAEERFLASQGAKVSLADLCLATGVSQSSLYRAFHTVCGESPLAYIRKRQLNEARRALLRSPAYRGAVKNAALTVGFTEFGRFSAEYRQIFGESPSATLSKNIDL